MIQAKGWAAIKAKENLGPWIFERREPGPHDVQFDILFCGVCHSDIHQVREDWGKAIFPMVPGLYETVCGRVVRVGDHVTKFKPGELVGSGCMVDSCRQCDNCRLGLEQFCSGGTSWAYNSYEQDKKTPTYGGYSNTIVIHEDFVVHIDEKLNPAAVAPLLCAGISTYSPLKHWKIGPGHKLGVLGLGGVGHMAVKFGVAFGAEVTVLSTSPAKEADAMKLGAHKFVVTSDDEQAKKIISHFDFILDTISAPHDLNFYLSFLKTNGVHICVALPVEPFQLNAFSVTSGRKSFAGTSVGGIAETQEMLDYCAVHNIVSDIELIDIKNVDNAFERMEKGDVRYRFVIDMASL